MSAHLLVVAKAPVPGLVKTRLAATVGNAAAADLAAAALLDTLEAGRAAFNQVHLALAGSLDDAVRSSELLDAVAGWDVFEQTGADFGARLVAAHRHVGRSVVQIGMDTPQVTPADLRDAADALAGHDAVLGPALDGGWWVLALRDPRRTGPVATVPMSRPDTGIATAIALRASGLDVGTTTPLRDVDSPADADAVAAEAPGSRFAALWRELGLAETAR